MLIFFFSVCFFLWGEAAQLNVWKLYTLVGLNLSKECETDLNRTIIIIVITIII